MIIQRPYKNFSKRGKLKYDIKVLLARLGFTLNPDFVILGAQKAGTTSLFEVLKQHSKIYSSSVKEVHYFSHDDWYNESKNHHQYQAFFPMSLSLPNDVLTYESTPIYLFHPEVAKRLYKFNKKLKLIMVLRSPAERALSAWTMYHHKFKQGYFAELQDSRSFSAAIQEEMKAIDENGYRDQFEHHSYIKRGIYYFQIERYLEYFDESQILILESDELKNNFEKVLEQLMSFLNLPKEHFTSLNSNVSSIKRSQSFNDELNKLRKFYEPYNEKLYELIGKRFLW